MRKFNEVVALFAACIMMISIASCNNNVEEPKKPVLYTVTIADTNAKGTVTADKTNAEENTTITLTIITNDGYEFESIAVKQDENDVIVTEVTKGEKYTFVMPKGNVTITVTFKDIVYIGTKKPTQAKEYGDIVFSDGSATPFTIDLTLTEEQKAAAIAVIFYKGTGCSNVDENGNLAVRTLGIGLKNTNEEDPRLYDFAKYNSSGFVIFEKTICNKVENPPTDGTPYHTYGYYSETLYATGDFDGSDNWNEMCKVDSIGTTEENYQEIYPAFYWANNYASKHGIIENFSNGWYVPTVVELLFAYERMDTLNAILTVAGGMKVGNDTNTHYITSSQDPDGKNASWIVYFTETPHAYGAWKGGYGGGIVCAIREF